MGVDLLDIKEQPDLPITPSDFLVDSHCHLNFPELLTNLESVLQNAREGNVRIMQTVCTNMGEFEQLLTLASKYNEVFCSVGVHPLNIDDTGTIASIEEIVKRCDHPKVIGIGETGLDFYRADGPEAIKRQKSSFINHIEASIETGIPLIVHSREAEAATLEILQNYNGSDEQRTKQQDFKIGPGVNGVIHCFTGSRDFAEACMDLGFYISASGVLTFKNAKDLHETFRNIPMERILIETDSPYLAPTPYRGKSNQPAYVVEVAKFLADLKGISFEEVAVITTANFLRLFNKASIR